MATANTSDVVAAPPPIPPPSCVCCGDELPNVKVLLKPCRSCLSDYCQECLAEMFKGATTDSTRFPPKCCNLLLLHTAIASLTDEEANEYRKKLEEWLSINKLYCPAPRCSAFISDRHLPPHGEQVTAPTLQSILADIIKQVTADPSARFFRGEPDITTQQGYAAVPRHMDLKEIQAQADNGHYATQYALTSDVLLIVSNAKTYYHGPGHPVAKTADQLLNRYLQELSAAMTELLRVATVPKTQEMFTCPTCHIGICTKCKQIEHGKSACDTSAQDHELAMLEQFRYKRCPNCKTAVRKMFGCSHMQCICGAHFCYWCQRSTSECDGACSDRDDSEEEDESDEEDDSEEDLPLENHPIDAPQAVLPGGQAYAGPDRNDLEPNAYDEDFPLVLSVTSGSRVQPHPPQPSAAPGHDDTGSDTLQTGTRTLDAGRFVNLDAGGGAHWGDSGLDFGDEPEDEGYVQVWSCSHEFCLYTMPTDGHNHGDLSRMECCRCAERVVPDPPVQAKHPPFLPNGKKRKSRKSRDSAIEMTPQKEQKAGPDEQRQAWECRCCRLVVCLACRAQYPKAELID